MLEARTWIVRSLQSAGWAPLLVFLVHVVASTTGAYHAWPSLDVPMHVLGGGVIAYFFARCLALAVEGGLVGRPSRLLLDVLVIALTCAAAVVWEFAEWTRDWLTAAQDQLDLNDTLLDMALGIAAGAAFVMVSRLRAPVTG